MYEYLNLNSMYRTHIGNPKCGVIKLRGRFIWNISLALFVWLNKFSLFLCLRMLWKLTNNNHITMIRYSLKRWSFSWHLTSVASSTWQIDRFQNNNVIGRVVNLQIFAQLWKWEWAENVPKVCVCVWQMNSDGDDEWKVESQSGKKQWPNKITKVPFLSFQKVNKYQSNVWPNMDWWRKICQNME